MQSLRALARSSALLLPVLLFAACGDDGGTDPTDGGTGTDGSTEACFDVQGSITQSGLEISRPKNDSRACLEVGAGEAAKCEEVDPDFSCLGASEPLGTPTMVTLRGCLIAFGLDIPTTALKTVAVLHELDGNGMPADPGYDLTGPAGAQQNNSPAAFIGSAITTAVDRAECADEGHFEIAGVPTETQLILRVTEQNEPKEDRSLVDTYQYNVILRNSAITDETGAPVSDPSSCTPATCFVTEEANAIQDVTFTTTARAAGVSSIPGEGDLYDGQGQGHIAGEVQDCGSTNTIQEAVVAVSADIRKLAYFNVGMGEGPFNYQDPKPQSGRRSTNADGLYTAIGVDTAPGGTSITVGAAITPSVCGADGICHCTPDNMVNPNWTAADQGEGETIVLATRTVYVFPDSITILSFDRNLYTKLD